MSRRLRRRAARAHRRPSPQTSAFPPAPGSPDGEDQLLSLALTVATADAPDTPVEAWARVGRDASYCVLVCRGCGGREEFLMWEGPPTVDNVQRSPLLFGGPGGQGRPLPRFAARHAACPATGPATSADASDAAPAARPVGRWQVPARLGADVGHWADQTIGPALDAVAADGEACAWALLGDPVAVGSDAGSDAGRADAAPRTLMLRLPDIPPGMPRGVGHRRWHATLCDASAAAGRRLAAVLVVAPATARPRAAASSAAAPPAAAESSVVLVLLATPTAAYNRLMPDTGGIAPEWGANPWAPVTDPSALIDGLFAGEAMC